ncbi:hypothetical protein [Paraclostridium sordellii]|nr:hypothetical protein [Paeniclostridium sordellii]
MSEEERIIEKEVKHLLSDLNSLVNRYEVWYSNCNNKNKTYQNMLSFREIDKSMLKESKLDISIDNLEKSYNTLNNYIQPSIKFSMSLKERNIKINNMDLNEKKLIIDPLRKHIFHLKDWEAKKDLFEENLSKAYESIINKFSTIDISAIESYASSYLDLSLSKNDSVVEKVNLIETVLNNGKVSLEVHIRVFGDMLNHKDSLEEELGDHLDKIYTLYEYVTGKFPDTKDGSRWISSVDKRLRATKKMWYYSNILRIIVPTLEMIRISAVSQLSLLMLYAKDDEEKNLSDFNISLNNITTLMGILPSYVKSNTYVKEVPYGSKVLTIKEFCFGRSIFKEINGILVSIEYDADKELTLEEQFATSVVGYEF